MDRTELRDLVERILTHFEHRLIPVRVHGLARCGYCRRAILPGGLAIYYRWHYYHAACCC